MSRRSPIGLTLFALAIFAVAFYLALHFSRRGEDTAIRTQVALGTLVEVQVRGMERAAAWKAMDAAFAEVRRLDTLFSTYTERSPVRRLNDAEDTLLSVPDEVYALLRRCDSLQRLTGGAFDIAIEPLIQAWGFDGEQPSVPPAAALQSALQHSGWSGIRLSGDGTVAKRPGAGINFGAIAKGYAVDRAVEVLRKEGVDNALVNAGGEVRSTGGTWSIGIQHPRSPSELAAIIDLHGRAIATSGDYEQYFEVDGQRYHHILDPATGTPARGCRSVTVIADDVAAADALATAIFVMGPRKGMAFCKAHPGIEVYIIDEQGEEHHSPGFESYRTR